MFINCVLSLSDKGDSSQTQCFSQLRKPVSSHIVIPLSSTFCTFYIFTTEAAFGEKSMDSFKRSNRVVQNKLSILLNDVHILRYLWIFYLCVTTLKVTMLLYLILYWLGLVHTSWQYACGECDRLLCWPYTLAKVLHQRWISGNIYRSFFIILI